MQVEAVRVWQRDCRTLVYDHWQELGLDLDLEIAPDYDKMHQLEAMGMWRVITARRDKELVGYVLALVSKHLHYRNSPMMFIIDAYYIKPEVRNGTGVKLIKYCEQLAKFMDCIKIYLTCKVHKDHSRLFERMGYSLSDYAFIKRI